MNNIKILIYGLLLLISVQTSYAQTSANIPAKFSKEQLIGKKWTKSTTIDSSQKKIVNKHGKITMGSKNVTIGVGADFSLSYVFDKDSVTLTATVNGEPIVMRYAYYLSDSFECDFNSSKVGGNFQGNWLNTYMEYMVGGKKKTEENCSKILSLTDQELVFGFAGSDMQISFNAEPLP